MNKAALIAKIETKIERVTESGCWVWMGRLNGGYGHMEVERAEYRLAAWINESKKDGSKYMKIKISPKEVQQNGAAAGNQPKTAEFDDEIPF